MNNADSRKKSGYGTTDHSGERHSVSRSIDVRGGEATPLMSGSQRTRAWSIHDSTPLIGGTETTAHPISPPPGGKEPNRHSRNLSVPQAPQGLHMVPHGYGAEAMALLSPTGGEEKKRLRPKNSSKEKRRFTFAHYIIYAAINIIISVPGLYGYAAVIFNHAAFQSHMNALSKLVIFSSCIHQLGFTLFSGLPFAIGTVQDAGLIFLSAMSNIIAESILADGGTVEEIVSTTLVILPMGTSLLGIVLVAMGKLRVADAVSYLPMPVVGGYLAFIGYFCLEAGVALCISESMMMVTDWAYLLDAQNLLLAIPGLAAGLALTMISRKATNDAALPLAMVVIPAAFYIIIFATGTGIDGAREGGWVGEEAPPVPVKDLLKLVDFRLVKWRLISKCITTWVGMVFVVSFASCLDVAAISMDMGEALDTNKELATVGVANFLSGLMMGFTGSYIFSQTIFTYRTMCHSRWIGILIMVAFIGVVVSTVNFLQVAPLFFLGSTLIFIGYDLLYEWLIEVRHKVFLSEYCIVVATFVAIQVIGIDFGIIFGVVVAVIDHVVTTARVSTLTRVSKRSRAVWKPDDWKVLQMHAYNVHNPKIITLEVTGSVFFGSSLQLLAGICDEIGLDASAEENKELSLASPHTRSSYIPKGDSPTIGLARHKKISRPTGVKYVVLDLKEVPNLDATAARTCFLQLAKMCAKRGMVVCASGAVPRVDWMLRSHEVAYDLAHEADLKSRMLMNATSRILVDCDKVLLFLTLYEALEFCETLIVHKITSRMPKKKSSFIRLDELAPPSALDNESTYLLSNIFSHMLGLSQEEGLQLKDNLNGQFEEVRLKAGDSIFKKYTHSDAFFVVLQGAAAISESKSEAPSRIVSGAGKVAFSARGSLSNLIEAGGDDLGNVSSFLQVGGVFGYVDLLLDQPRSYGTVASKDDTVLARFSRSRLGLIKAENADLDIIIQRVLLQASALDLANCTCGE